MNTFFQRGEVVWGKIKGYPWWPCVIIDSINSLKYKVKFFNDNTYGNLSSNFLLKYEENKKKILDANKKNKKLINAINAADLELKKNFNINKIDYKRNINENTNIINNNKNNQLKHKNYTYTFENIETKNFENINKRNKNNNYKNKTELMLSKKSRANIFSIEKKLKSIVNEDNNFNYNSHISSPRTSDKSHMALDKINYNVETNNNNDIIINKNILSLDNDDKITLLLLTSKKSIENNKNDTGKGKNIKKMNNKIKKEEEIKKEIKKEKEIKNDKVIVDQEKEKIKPEKYFIKIEIENLDVKNIKKKDNKIDDKIKDEKKRREEEDYFIYQIDEYFYKIFELFKNQKYDKLNYEKANFKKVLIFLSKYKRPNFIEFLKMTNISKYIQYFVCYLKSYDIELNDLAKKVYRNFHKQFNRDFFNSQNILI